MSGRYIGGADFWVWQLDDPRLDCAIMRPMESDGDHFLTYYLTKDDDAAEQFKNSRADPRGVDALQEEEDVRLSLVILFSLYTYEKTTTGHRIPLCARLRSGKSRARSTQ